MSIPFLNLAPMHSQIRSEILDCFSEVYASNWFVMGDKLAKFEQEYAKFSSSNFAVGVSNGLDALHLSLRALNISQGDEVILPSNTFIATVLAVSSVGARPIFVEPDPKTYNLSTSKIEVAITKKTKAVIPVHLYGQACQMDTISDIARRRQLFVIEDNAQAHGATYKGKVTGSWGQANATSFYPGKNLGAFGDGGAVTCDDESIARKLRLLRNYGSEHKYSHEIIGYNMRLDELQAAFLSVKLRLILEWNRDRQKIAGYYEKYLSGLEPVILPYTDPHATHVYHLYVIQTNKRDELQEHLRRNKITTLVHYPTPPHLQGAYKHLGIKKGMLPIAERLADSCLSLPIWPGMSEDQVIAVTSSIYEFFHRQG